MIFFLAEVLVMKQKLMMNGRIKARGEIWKVETWMRIVIELASDYDM